MPTVRGRQAFRNLDDEMFGRESNRNKKEDDSITGRVNSRDLRFEFFEQVHGHVPEVALVGRFEVSDELKAIIIRVVQVLTNRII